HGEFKLGNKTFYFRIKPHFPKKVTPEFLLVDLVNNLHSLAEDNNEVMKKVTEKIASMDKKKLKYSVAEYGSVKTKKLFAPLLQSSSI
ncbi:MAG: hypothetical protein IT249_15650, partial [Chitinophagaceae bacterium]|nr:hypothetical protein [Chitinophagaceae bacterium]